MEIDAVIFNDALNAINSIGETRVHKHTNMIQELQQVTSDGPSEFNNACLDTRCIGLEEHEQTDILAKQGLNTKIFRKLKVLLDLIEIKSKIDEYILEEWQELYNTNVTGKHFKSVEQLVTTKRSKYTRTNRRKEVTISRLRH